MKLFDDVFQNLDGLLSSQDSHRLDLSNPWKETDENEIIFKNDTAYELGGGTCEGISGIAYTTDKNHVSSDEILLYGEDLDKLDKDANYARIVLVRLNEDSVKEGNSFYQTLRRIDYTRYHVFPEGFMMRISSMNKKESVRVSKQSLKKGISFSNVGSLFIESYKKQPTVESVKIIFITDPNFDYKKLSQIMTKSENITKALDHLVNKVKMDCHSCSLQVVCNEVENLVKEDFNK